MLEDFSWLYCEIVIVLVDSDIRFIVQQSRDGSVWGYGPFLGLAGLYEDTTCR